MTYSSDAKPRKLNGGTIDGIKNPMAGVAVPEKIKKQVRRGWAGLLGHVKDLALAPPWI